MEKSDWAIKAPSVWAKEEVSIDMIDEQALKEL
jgi:hypothetical protein